MAFIRKKKVEKNTYLVKVESYRKAVKIKVKPRYEQKFENFIFSSKNTNYGKNL